MSIWVWLLSQPREKCKSPPLLSRHLVFFSYEAQGCQDGSVGKEACHRSLMAWLPHGGREEWAAARCLLHTLWHEPTWCKREGSIRKDKHLVQITESQWPACLPASVLTLQVSLDMLPREVGSHEVEAWERAWGLNSLSCGPQNTGSVEKA